MSQKKFTKKIRPRKTADVTRKTLFVSMLVLVLGVVIILTASIYMLLNLSSADSIVVIWYPVMIAGVVLVFISQLIKWLSGR